MVNRAAVSLLILVTGLSAAPAKISPELRAEWWKAMAELQAIRPQYERARAKVSEAEAAIAKDCGKDQTVVFDEKAGEPVCKPTPKAAAPVSPRSDPQSPSR